MKSLFASKHKIYETIFYKMYGAKQIQKTTVVVKFSYYVSLELEYEREKISEPSLNILYDWLPKLCAFGDGQRCRITGKHT